MTDQVQARLLRLAALFLALYSLAITMSPAVRLRTWPVSLLWQHWIGLFVWVVMTALVHRQTAVSLPERDPFIFPTAALLTGWGMLAQFRLDPTFGFRQSAWLVVAGIIFLLVLRRKLPMSILRRYKYLILTGGLVLTGLTFLFGTNPLGFGPKLWLGCCGIYLQPSEPLKFFFIIYLSAYIADRQLFLKSLSQNSTHSSTKHIANLLPVLAPSLVMTGLTLLLMIFQRDLGTASIFLFLFTVMIYLTIQDRWVLGLSFVSLIVSGVFGYLLFDVIRLRIDSWLNPWLDPSGRSFQIVQSLLAAANGGLFGRGPGLGNPGLVPIAHSDFIFSSITEEMGVLGGIGLIGLLAVIAHRGLKIAFGTPDLFKRLLAVGITSYLAGQSILIIGGNLRLFPLTGVTLPFVSYGGSSLVTSYLALLVLIIISSDTEITSSRPFVVKPYLLLHFMLLSGFSALALTLGWWGIFRGPDLLNRTDNARRTISDRFVKRGSIYDRQGNLLVVSTGESGSYLRVYNYPDLSPLIGYTHPVYGQSGIEAILDPWLRGLEGYSPAFLWWEWLLYGTPPAGLDIRLTIDLQIQQQADVLLGDLVGAVVVIDPTSGDLLALASHPTFDPNELAQNWAELVNDPDAPFVNRVLFGQYPPGTVLTPLLLANAYDQSILPKPSDHFQFALENDQMDCALPLSPNNEFILEAQLKAGCPGLTAALGDQIGPNELLRVFKDLGLYQSPDLGFPVQDITSPDNIENAASGALGITPPLRLSPLQVVTAAAALSNAGTMPVPNLILALNYPSQGWQSQPPLGTGVQILQPNSIEKVVQLLQIENSLFWQYVSVSTKEGQSGPAFTWWLGGTLSSGSGRPLTIAVLLESNAPELAVQIGQSLQKFESSPATNPLP